MTADYDLWLRAEDIEALNAAVKALDLSPNLPPDEARRRGRYVLENDVHVDVLVARSAPTKDDGEVVAFDDVWSRRQLLPYGPSVTVAVPSIADLVRTKRWGLRQKDLADIQLLEALLRAQRGGSP